MLKLERLLVVEDDPTDMREAAETARGLGIGVIEGMSSSELALIRLDRGLRGELSLPDAVVVDLDLGVESGYELLRFWHANRRVSAIPLVVWSRLGENHKAVCEAFKITGFVSKHEGPAALREALEALGSARVSTPKPNLT